MVIDFFFWFLGDVLKPVVSSRSFWRCIDGQQHLNIYAPMVFLEENHEDYDSECSESDSSDTKNSTGLPPQ